MNALPATRRLPLRVMLPLLLFGAFTLLTLLALLLDQRIHDSQLVYGVLLGASLLLALSLYFWLTLRFGRPLQQLTEAIQRIGLGELKTGIQLQAIPELSTLADAFSSMAARLDASQETLRENEARYRSLFENNHTVMLIIDPADGAIVDANAKAENFYGWTRAQLLTMNMSEINTMPPDEMKAALARAHAEQRQQFFFKHRLANGMERDVEVFTGPIVIGAWQLLYSIVYDITARRQAEKALRESEESFSFLAQRSLILLELPKLADTLEEVAFMQLGLEMAELLTESQVSFIHFVGDNEETIELVTWSRRTLETYCHAVSERHYPISQAGIWAEALRQRQPVVFNDYATAPDKRGLPDGHALLQRLISLPVIEHGKVVMLAGIGNKATDYTNQDTETLQLIANDIWRLVQRGRNQQQIARFGRLLESSLGEFFSFDALSLRFVDVNHGACKNLGYSLDELRQMTPLDIKPEITPEAFARTLEPLRSGAAKIVAFTTLHRRKNGTTYPAEIHIEINNEANPLFLVTARDVTERHRLEQNLRQLAQAVEQSPESIVISNLDAQLEYVNTAFIKNTGYSRAEALGQNPRVLQSGKTPKETYAAMWEALTHGHEWQGELFNRRKDGSEYVEWASISPIRQPNGHVTHYLAIKQDITERRRVRQELIDNLAHQKELNAKLEAAQNQLLQSEKMASIGQLAAGVAHELNNPIGFVHSNLGTLETYLEDIFAITDAYAEAETATTQTGPQLEKVHALKLAKDYDYLRTDIFQLMHESRDGLTRVAKIVKDLKDFSRAGEATSQWADLHAGIDSTLNIVWNELKYKCTVNKEYANLPQIWCVPSQLNQVFMNLLVNASHAIAEKGVITIRTGQQGEEVFVAISDTGSGIAPENLTRIFEPFFTTKDVGKGTGLGLSLAYSIVQKHHGRIEVASTVGSGTTFTVWLPVEPVEDKADAVPPAPTFSASNMD